MLRCGREARARAPTNPNPNPNPNPNDAQAECDAWLDVMPTTKSTVVRGYLHTREKKGGDGERARDRR